MPDCTTIEANQAYFMAAVSYDEAGISTYTSELTMDQGGLDTWTQMYSAYGCGLQSKLDVPETDDSGGSIGNSKWTLTEDEKTQFTKEQKELKDKHVKQMVASRKDK